MSGEKELLLSLPLDNKEREWMKERLHMTPSIPRDMPIWM